MRVLIAGVLAGIALFIWGAIAHTALPLGEAGMHAPGNEDAILAALREGLPKEGIYMLPYIASEEMSDEAAMQAWVNKSLANPYAMVIYQPQGRDNSQMGSMLGLQFGSDLATGFALAWVLSLIATGFGRRLGAAVAIGIIGWLATSVPSMNWYRFPLDSTLAGLVEESVGFFVAGAAAAWWLGRARAD
ncbi:MAG: hypothetical protein ACT4NL_07275 [Pseudomarimonas sp.]